jgi:hypothetical protein
MGGGEKEWGLTGTCDFLAGLDVFEGEDLEGEGGVVEAPEGVWSACVVDALEIVSVV